MADNEKAAEGTTPQGADWEVVTLTASAYAAAPGRGGTNKPTESKDLDASKGERGSSSALLMSDHFVFPPSEHENLPIQTEFDEIRSEKDGQELSTGVEDDGLKDLGGRSDVGSEGIQFFDQGKTLSVDELEVTDDTLKYAEDDARGFVVHDDDGGGSHDKLNPPLEPEDSKNCGYGFPCKGWWKKHASCLYHQAKETSTFWSVVAAAALVGLVILGHWHKDKLHLRQLKWHSYSAVREKLPVSCPNMIELSGVLSEGLQRVLSLKGIAEPC